MPYKDPEMQKAAQRRSYERRKEAIRKKTQNRRKELGYYKRGRVRKHARYVQIIKEEYACTDCGQRYHYCVMDFDHVRGEKRGTVSQLVAYGYGKTAIDEEIAKCDLVCSNCHRLRTRDRGS